MDDARYTQVFEQFLNGYWGAFHELLEAESVMPTRLAASLFDQVVDQHRRFARVSPPELDQHMDGLDTLWQQVSDHRRRIPDDPLTAAQLHEALDRFRSMYDRLLALGSSAAAADVLAHARHAHPRAPLRADTAI
jgi:hypothetical protein